MKSISAVVAFALFVFIAPALGQWEKRIENSVPRTRDGKPNLSAPAPKTADGKTDLSGVWLPDPDPQGSPEGVEHMIFPRYFVNIAADMKMEDVPLTPAAAAVFRQRLQNEGKDSPMARCAPTGVPALNAIPLPYKIVQTSRLILVLYEENSVFRQIFMDGRNPVKDPEPRYIGYSTGSWDGDTLVVNTTGFNDRTWLDAMGHPHSDALQVTERFRRRDAGHLDVEVTINDPKTYTKPLTYTQKATLVPDGDLLEYFCSDNEKDVQHFK
jgi:hypothetical protein